MQIGWCSLRCIFSQDGLGTGVGDTLGSYGFDGSKKRIWHLESRPYGTTFWRNGDIIGVLVDLDEKTITYCRNGKSLGLAFENINFNGPGYPAVSLAFHESLTANFGSAPFRFPQPGYQPIQDPPLGDLKKCESLLGYLSDLAHLNSKMAGKKGKDVKLANGGTVAEDAVILIFGSMIVERLAGFFANRFIVEALIFPYIKRLCVMRSIQGKSSPILPGNEESTLGSLLTLLWDHMDYDEITKLLETLVSYMESVYKEIANDVDYEKQRSIIVILTCLCNHTKTRKYLLKEVLFKNNW